MDVEQYGILDSTIRYFFSKYHNTNIWAWRKRSIYEKHEPQHNSPSPLGCYSKKIKRENNEYTAAADERITNNDIIKNIAQW
jgi:hypothetical protein